VSLHVETRGTGRDLVLLHGWGLHSGVWDEALPALQARFRVHAVDLPGHGYSRDVAVGSFDEAVDAVAPWVPPGAVVCGWSLGGLFAQRLVQRHPARAARVALVATTPCFEARADWPHGMKSSTLTGFATALANDRDAMLKRFVALNAMHGPHGRDAVRAFTRRLAERGAPSDAGLATAFAWLREVDLRKEAPALRVPAVVMHGGRDMVGPAGAARWLAGQVPGARLVELPDAAHMPFFSHRDAFVEAVGGLVG
jgi:pimeloyl-[acyl-carrier protein] methyl ester esterase